MHADVANIGHIDIVWVLVEHREVGVFADLDTAVHRIALQDLEDAPAACNVVDDFLRYLGDKVLVSDAPEFEARWLSRLLQSCGHAKNLKIADYHGTSFARFSGLALDMLYETLERRPAPHRAGPDSARLAHAWRVALQY